MWPKDNGYIDLSCPHMLTFVELHRCRHGLGFVFPKIAIDLLLRQEARRIVDLSLIDSIVGWRKFRGTLTGVWATRLRRRS